MLIPGSCQRKQAKIRKHRSGSAPASRICTRKKPIRIGIGGYPVFRNRTPFQKTQIRLSEGVAKCDTPFLYRIFRNGCGSCVPQWNRSPGRTVGGRTPLGTGAGPSQMLSGNILSGYMDTEEGCCGNQKMTLFDLPYFYHNNKRAIFQKFTHIFRIDGKSEP